MMKSASPPLRRKYLQNRYLLLFVGILVASVLATFLQVNSRSTAAEVNKVEVTRKSPEAVLHTDDKTCTIRTRGYLLGNTDRVAGMVKSISKSARNGGLTVDAVSRSKSNSTVEAELALSKQFDLAEVGAIKEHCTTKAAIEEHRGRALAEVPQWARGMLAAAAATAVYLAVVFAVTATFAFLAPEFVVYGEIAGGCVGGFLSTYVANLINKSSQEANLTQSAVQCISGAALNISVGEMKVRILKTIKAWLRSDAQSVAASASHSDLSRSSSFFSAISEFADAIHTP